MAIRKKIKFDGLKDRYLVVMLGSTSKDLGFFDVDDTVDRTQFSGYTATTEYKLFNTPYTVTGSSSSRLDELAKYVVSPLPWIKFYLSNTLTTNGLDLSKSVTGGTGVTRVYTYYLGGITYVDTISSGTTATTTNFSFAVTGFSHNNFDNFPLVKYETKGNLVENSQVSSDVFIVRQQQAVFERNYRLRALNALNDVLTYGGNFFVVYNNT